MTRTEMMRKKFPTGKPTLSFVGARKYDEAFAYAFETPLSQQDALYWLDGYPRKDHVGWEISQLKDKVP